MIGTVVITHGQLGKELVETARRIVGELDNVEAVSMGWHDDVEDSRARVQAAIDRLRREDGLLLLTDMFGGTPTNLALTWLERDRVEVVTGVNLPMLIKLAGLRSGKKLAETADQIRAQGMRSISVASEALAARD